MNEQSFDGVLSLGTDYLGFLNQELRDLRGFTTLAHELIQNADDAPETTRIIFDVCDDALIVENNGLFTDCGAMEATPCPWLASKGHRCDLHRFRLTAAGDKRKQRDTIGAFGIGFIAVYQVTDRPELLTGKHNWILWPEEPQDERVKVRSVDKAVPGTRFRFPWASDPNSAIRQALSVEPISEEKITELLQELRRTLPSAILFLRKLDHIELKSNGRHVVTIERERDGDLVLVSETSDGRRKENFWHLFHGDFENEADQLRRQVGIPIEDKRHAAVEIALKEPNQDEAIDAEGLFHAFLPTQHSIGIPLHINADFYTSSDRKRILFEQDYQGNWNRAAVEAAARIVSASLVGFRDILGHQVFWKLLDEIYQKVEKTSEEVRYDGLDQFWRLVKPHLETGSFVYSSQNQWLPASKLRLLQSIEKERASIPILEQLGLKIVHPDLNSYSNPLRGIGVSYLTGEVLVSALKANGLDQTTLIGKSPAWIQEFENRLLLADEIVVLLGRSKEGDVFDNCAIVVSVDGRLASPRTLRRAAPETQDVFSVLQCEAVFADTEQNPDSILQLVRSFDVQHAIDLLSDVPREQLLEQWRSDPTKLVDLIDWFPDHRSDFRGNPNYSEKLRNLQIWPSGDQLYRLGELVVPGGFDDPLDLTQVIDQQVLDRFGEFLRNDLSARELTFETYVTKHVPQAYRSGTVLPADVQRNLIELLASNLGKMRSHNPSRAALENCPMIECRDGAYRRATEVYFGSALVCDMLGNSVPSAILPEENTEAIKALYSWLGVTDIPRPEDIVGRIRKLVSKAPEPSNRSAIQRILVSLGGEWLKKYEYKHDAFGELKKLAWLPATASNQWFKPEEIYASYQDYLFASQAHFLDIPRQDQNRASKFIAYLEIKDEPDAKQVVRHLLQAAARNDFGLNFEVYTFLNRKAGGRELAELRTTKCLLLETREGTRYVSPDEVFFGEHPFGKYRYRLGDQFRPFTYLMSRLNVKDSPTPEDAIAVLEEIAEEFGDSNRPLDEDSGSYSVLLQCWKMLSDGLADGILSREDLRRLEEAKVIPNDRQVLNYPAWMFFEDRPQIKEKFDALLKHNVIPRPQGIWQAMEATGVQPLSQAVTVGLVECDRPEADEGLAIRIKEREPLIERVMAAQNGEDWNRQALHAMKVTKAHNLKVNYSIDVFDRHQTTEPEDASAYFEDDTLYYRNESKFPWSAIARELTYAFSPRGEAGQISPALKEVLQSNSSEDAERELSELGFAQLQEWDTSQIAESQPSGFGGSKGAEKTDSDTVAAEGESDEAQKVDSDEVDEEVVGADKEPSETAKAGEKDGKSKMKGKLRTYVVSDDGSAGETPGFWQKDFTAVDRAGIAHVLAFERASEREAEEMTHSNPGYDVISKDKEGNIVRYIEVKSLVDKWDSTGTGLSRVQFELAQELKEDYWLYVVERAAYDDARIYPIQNPANQVNQFLYDAGWRAVSVNQQTEDEKKRAQNPRGKRRSILDLRKKGIDQERTG